MRPEYVAARATCSAADDTSVPTTRIRGRTGSGSATSSMSIASVNGSSPVEQPALQTTASRPWLAARLSTSGRMWWRSASICGRARWKCVSWIVTASSSRWRSDAASKRSSIAT